MRIAIWHNLPSGGARRALLSHTEALLAAGHRIAVWSPDSPNEDPLPSFSSEVEVTVVPLSRGTPPPTSRSARVESALRIRQDVQVMARNAQECVGQMRRWGADLLFANSCLRLGTPLIGRFFDGPSLAYLQEPNRPLYEAGYESRQAMRARSAGDGSLGHWGRLAWDAFAVQRERFLIREERLSVQAYGRVLCNSDYSRESILRALGRSAYVCRLAVDESLVGAADRRTGVISVGQLSPSKRPNFILDALAAVPGAPHLTWVANIADEGALHAFASRADARGVNATVLRSISDEQLAAHLAGACAFVYAPRLEPFGLAPLEAALNETPTVAVREAGVRETVIDGVTGWLTEDDPVAFGSVLAAVLDDDDARVAAGRAAREHVLATFSRAHGDAAICAHVEAARVERPAGRTTP